MGRFRHLGLQRRIMLYVTLGLTAMFGVGAFVGSAAIDQATALVFNERLATAFTTAGIVERDFARLAADVESVLAQSNDLSTDRATDAARLQKQLGQEARYPFFVVVGVCLADEAGRVLGEAGTVRLLGTPTDRCAGPAPASPSFVVARARWTAEGWVSMADLIVPAGGDQSGAAFAVMHLASLNRIAPFDPAEYGRVPQEPSASADSGRESGEYNLEIVDPDGLTVLGIGRHEVAGAPSPHYSALRQVLSGGDAVSVLDEGNPTVGLEPHVMAVVPLADSPFYLLLEQPTDVALALPIQLRERLVLLVVVGFLAASMVAWFTTRRVVQPTERLTAAAERMALGDFASAIDVAAQDEIAVLAQTLDTMRIRLLDAHDQLESNNRDLERRVAERTARLEQVLRKVISVQEDERYGLARELHDETAQTLAALSIALDRVRDDIERAPSGALEQIQAAKDIATRLLAETRRQILGLRPSVLDDLGLGPAIAWYAETTLESLGITREIDVAHTARLPQHLEVSLFRITQEAINNVAKHASAANVRVVLRLTDGLATLTITDDGVGFDVERALAHAPESGSVGLAGMQERVALLGGTLIITSRLREETRVEVRVPVAIGDAA